MKDLMQFSLSLLTALLWCVPVIQSPGQVIVWGDNTYGQTNVPASATNVIALAAGDGHCLALRADGTVEAWGANVVFGEVILPAKPTFFRFDERGEPCGWEHS